MAGAYSQGIIELLNGTIDWKASGGSLIKAMLTAATYSLNKETHEYLDDVSASRVAGSTDQTLTLVDPAEDTANDQVEIDANDITYSSVPGSVSTGEVIVYYDSTVEATSTLIAYLDFTGGDITTNGSDITVQFHGDGIVAYNYGA